MEKFNTKYFGEITLTYSDVMEDWAECSTVYNGKVITFCFAEWKKFGDKQKTCLEIIDSYMAINEMAKNAIIYNFYVDKAVEDYFKYFFDEMATSELLEVFGTTDFKKMDINSVVKKLVYPNILFNFVQDNVLSFNVDYFVHDSYFNDMLSVCMDEKLNILGFVHDC
jgi:hypothetical protein